MLSDPWQWYTAIKKHFLYVLAVVFLTIGCSLIYHFNVEDDFKIKISLRELLNGESNEMEELRISGVMPVNRHEIFQLFLKNFHNPKTLEKIIYRMERSNSSQINQSYLDQEVVALSNRISVSEPEFEESDLSFVAMKSELVLSKGVSRNELNNLAKIVLEVVNEDTVEHIESLIKTSLSSNIALRQLNIAGIQSEIDAIRRHHNIVTSDRVKILEEEIQDITDLSNNMISDEILRIDARIEATKAKDNLNLLDEIDTLNLKIDQYKISYEKRLADEILVLEEDISVAEAVGIEKPLELSQLDSSGLSMSNFSNVRPRFFDGWVVLNQKRDLMSNRQDMEAYTEGIRDLQRELNILSDQVNDESFVEGIRDLQIEKDSLMNSLGKEEFIGGLRELQTELNRVKLISDNDSYTEDLRGLEKDLFIAQNDPDFANLRELYEQESIFPDGEYASHFDILKPNIIQTNISLPYAVFIGVLVGIVGNIIWLSIFIVSSRGRLGAHGNL